MSVAQAQEPTLQERAFTIAAEHGIDPITFQSLITSESEWNELADNGDDRGIVQINRTYHPEVADECAFNADCSMEWAASYIKTNGYDAWSVCNCYSFSKVVLKRQLPNTKSIVPNAKLRVGTLAIFNYKGVMHYAAVIDVGETTFTVRESNYKPCVTDTRVVSRSDKNLVGFFK